MTQMINFPTRIQDCDSQSPALLDLFLSSDPSICSTMVFPLLENSNPVVVSVSIDFYHIHNRIPCFITLLMTILLLICLRDHLRDAWNNMFNLRTSAAAREFCEWVQVRIDLDIAHRKYEVKPHSSPWFSAVCAAAIVH